MTLIYPIIAGLLCAIIEYVRIMRSWGVPNVNKLWTITIGVIFFIVCLSLSVGYYHEIWPYHVAVYGVYFASCRAIFYDLMLNILRGLPIDYRSRKTNSKHDQFTANIGFWSIKCFYLFLGILSGYLWMQWHNHNNIN